MTKVHITPNIIPLLQKGAYDVTKQGDSVFVQVNSTKTDFSQDIHSPVLSPSVQAKMEELGIKPDLLNYNILLFVKQLGLKITPLLLRQIRTIAMRFPGREKKAAEITSLLKSKGLKTDLKTIELLLLELENTSQDNEDLPKENKNNNPFFQFLATLPALTNRPGILTAMNQIKTADGNKTGKNWVILPFNIISTDTLELEGKGTLKLLLDNYTDKAEKILINIEFSDSRYIFHFNLNHGKITELFYSDDKAAETTSETERLINCLTLFSKDSFNIQWSPYSDLEGFSEGKEKLTTLEAMV